MFIPKLRYLGIYAPEHGCDIGLFAIGSSIIASTINETDSQEILAIAKSTAEALNECYGRKELYINDLGDLMNIQEKMDSSYEKLLEYADLEDDQEYHIENAQDTPTQKNEWQDIIPESTLQEHIEWLSTSDEIPAMAIWSNYLIESELSMRGYSLEESNIAAIADQIHRLVGYDNDHRDFILGIAFDRAIAEGRLFY